MSAMGLPPLQAGHHPFGKSPSYPSSAPADPKILVPPHSSTAVRAASAQDMVPMHLFMESEERYKRLFSVLIQVCSELQAVTNKVQTMEMTLHQLFSSRPPQGQTSLPSMTNYIPMQAPQQSQAPPSMHPPQSSSGSTVLPSVRDLDMSIQHGGNMPPSSTGNTSSSSGPQQLRTGKSGGAGAGDAAKFDALTLLSLTAGSNPAPSTPIADYSRLPTPTNVYTFESSFPGTMMARPLTPTTLPSVITAGSSSSPSTGSKRKNSVVSIDGDRSIGSTSSSSGKKRSRKPRAQSSGGVVPASSAPASPPNLTFSSTTSSPISSPHASDTESALSPPSSATLSAGGSSSVNSTPAKTSLRSTKFIAYEPASAGLRTTSTGANGLSTPSDVKQPKVILPRDKHDLHIWTRTVFAEDPAMTMTDMESRLAKFVTNWNDKQYPMDILMEFVWNKVVRKELSQLRTYLQGFCRKDLFAGIPNVNNLAPREIKPLVFDEFCRRVFEDQNKSPYKLTREVLQQVFMSDSFKLPEIQQE